MKTPAVRCYRCSGRDWKRVAIDFFSSCAYLILDCVGCHLRIAYKIPKPAVSRG